MIDNDEDKDVDNDEDNKNDDEEYLKSVVYRRQQEA